MVSNSRLVTPHTAAKSRASASTKIADSYSDNLIDDLFSDVDRILEGDLSGYMNVVGRKPKPAAARTVTLPSNFAPRSAAELYRATMSGGISTADASVRSTRTVSAQSPKPRPSAQPAFRPPAPPMNPRYGGRPVTTRQVAPQPSQTNASQTALVAPATISTATNDPSRYDAVAVAQSEPLRSLPNFAYTDPMPELALAPVSPRPPQTIFEPQKRPQPQPQSQSVSLPFLLVGAASISAVSTLGLWTLSQSEPGSGWLLSLSEEATAAEIPNHSDEDFLAYLQESLAVISARQSQTQRLSSVIPAAQAATLPTTVPNTNAAPQVGALPNLPGAAKTPSVIERVFVPVYENNADTTVAAVPSVPNVTTPTSSAKPNVPIPAPVAAAAAIPPGAPAPAAPSVPIVQSKPQPSPAPVAAAPTNAAAAAITDVTPTSEHVLVGVLNLGSRSAALFDIEGSSQRAYVGDRIGLSDWSLVAVNGQDVVIRRDGEVRSVYIGQQF